MQIDMDVQGIISDLSDGEILNISKSIAVIACNHEWTHISLYGCTGDYHVCSFCGASSKKVKGIKNAG